MGIKSWWPAIVAAVLFVFLFHSFLAWAGPSPLAIHILTLYAAGQVLSMGTFWTLDYLSQKDAYRHLAPFFSRPDTAAFAQKTDRIGSTVAFFGSWLYLAFAAAMILTGRYTQETWQSLYVRAHLALWRFAAVLAVVAPTALVLQIII